MKRQQNKLNMAKSQVGNTIILGPMTAVDSGAVSYFSLQPFLRSTRGALPHFALNAIS